MADEKSQDGDADKKQVKFSETSEKTTYNKEQDEGQYDEEVGLMRRSANSRGSYRSYRSTSSRTSSGEYKTGNSDTETDLTAIPNEVSTGKKAETDDEKIERLAKENDTDQDTFGINPSNGTAELKVDADVKDNKSISSKNSKESVKQDNESDKLKVDNTASKDTLVKEKKGSVVSFKQDNNSSDNSNLDKSFHDGQKLDNAGLSKADEKYRESSGSESKENSSESETDDAAQELSDGDSKQGVKFALPKAQSYSLRSRRPQSVTSFKSSSSTSSQITNDQNVPPRATPQDVNVTSGPDANERLAGGANNSEEINQANSTGQQTPDNSKEPISQTVDKHEALTEGSSESLKGKESDTNGKLDTANDSKPENEKEEGEEAQQPPAKQHVRLDLSSINGENEQKTSAVSNGRAVPHLKTDFRRARPLQTTATPVTITDAKTSTNTPSTSNTSATKSAGSSTKTTSQSARGEKERQAQSAGPGGRRSETARSASSRASSRSSYPSSRPRSCGNISERGRMKEFFQSELRRLKSSLTSEAKKFKKPKARNFYPYTYTSLVPYCNTYEANFLINMPAYGYKERQSADEAKSSEKSTDKREAVEESEENKEATMATRLTAIRLCDPWDSLNMDRNVLPKLETAELRQRRMEQLRSNPKPKYGNENEDCRPKTSPRTKRPEAKQGSTRLPKFPVIPVPNQELTTKELYYGDIPMIRDEVMKNYSSKGDERKKSDYTRTKQDFFRMELDRMNDYPKNNRPHMQAAYYAYLQNTPGSRKALTDCMKELNKKKEPQTPQAVA